MITFPNSKLNIGLQILERLPNAYHRIESILYPIPLCDMLEILPLESGKTELVITGLSIPEPEMEKNLCFNAWQILYHKFKIPFVKIHLHKKIPTGAGLGGGSSDAAFTLKMLNQLFRLNLSAQQLVRYAAQLGMDCPFFIENATALAKGKGEILSPIELDLSNYHILVVKPNIHIATAFAYSTVEPNANQISLEILTKQPVDQWKNSICNDFEHNIFPIHSEIKEIKKKMYDLGAVYAAMSGSGSAVFGLFSTKISVDGVFPNTFVFQSSMRLEC